MNRPTFFTLFALALLGSLAAFPAAAADAHYFLRYAGQETNFMVTDPQFVHRVRQFFNGHYDYYYSSHIERTGDTLMDAFTGPPETVQLVDQHILVVSDCRAHRCQEKALAVMDTQLNSMGFALLHLSTDRRDPKKLNRNGYITVFVHEGAPDRFKQELMEQVHVWQTRPDINKGSIIPTVVELTPPPPDTKEKKK